MQGWCSGCSQHVGCGGYGGHNGLADAVDVGDMVDMVDAVELVDHGCDCGPVDIERKDGSCVVVT